jgi:hypothetical protein
MSPVVVLASTVSTPRKSSLPSGQAASATEIEILIGLVALVLVVLAVRAWIASRDWRRRRRYRRERAEGAAVSLAARSAFARGDYMAVIGMDKPDLPAAIKLLVAQSYAQIGVDVSAANAAFGAIKAILAASDWSADEPTKGFSVLETRALRSWLDRLGGLDQDFTNPDRLNILRKKVLDRSLATPEEPVQLSGELDEIRERVASRYAAEKTATSRNRWINLAAGALAGGLAATSGVIGVAKGSLVVVAAILAFASAAITAGLTTLKPAEREKESQIRADALGQLVAAIDLFDIDRPDDDLSLLPAVKEVHERLSAAEGHGQIAPLLASSEATAKMAITSISPTAGPVAGGEDVTITGTGFTDATEVLFGATPAPSCRVDSDIQITATTPPAPKTGPVKVTVTRPGGASRASRLRYTYRATPR